MVTEVKDLLTVVEEIYHLSVDEQPKQVESRYSLKLDTKEQLYQRYANIGEQEQSIDGGWLTECSCLSIHNLAGTTLKQNPTEEQQEEIAKQILEVFIVNNPIENFHWLIPAGGSMRACPSELSLLRVRSQYGSIRALITVFPK